MNSKLSNCNSCNSSISKSAKVCTFCGDDIVRQRNLEIQYKSVILGMVVVIILVIAIQLGMLDHLLTLLIFWS